MQKFLRRLILVRTSADVADRSAHTPRPLPRSGPVYTAPPSQHAQVKKDAFKAAERELIFDIDLTDYDDVRTCCRRGYASGRRCSRTRAGVVACVYPLEPFSPPSVPACSGGGICGKCWAYMAVAVRLLDMSLRADFGFQSILFVYSGRRGVHCWVCDEGARALTNDARSAIVDYLSAMSGEGSLSDAPAPQCWCLAGGNSPLSCVLRCAGDGGAGAGGHGGSGGGVSLSKISAGITVPLHPAMRLVTPWAAS